MSSSLFPAPKGGGSSLSSLFSASTKSALDSNLLKRKAELSSKLSDEEAAKRSAHEALVRSVTVSDADADAASEVVRKEGVAIVEGCIDAEFVSQLLPASVTIEEEVAAELTRRGIPYRHALPGVDTGVVCSTDDSSSSQFSFLEASSRTLGRLDVKHNCSLPPFAALSDSNAPPALTSIVQSLLGKDAELAHAGLIFSYPGTRDQPFHQDGHTLFPDLDPSSVEHIPCYALNVFIPLHEITDGHGPTQFFPSSHKTTSSHLIQRDPATASRKLPTIAPLLKVSDALIYDYRTVHRGQANVGNDVRYMLYLMYCRPWFKDHINFGEEKLFGEETKTTA
jgi:hypothetical protein